MDNNNFDDEAERFDFDLFNITQTIDNNDKEHKKDLNDKTDINNIINDYIDNNDFLSLKIKRLQAQQQNHDKNNRFIQ